MRQAPVDRCAGDEPGTTPTRNAAPSVRSRVSGQPTHGQSDHGDEHATGHRQRPRRPADRRTGRDGLPVTLERRQLAQDRSKHRVATITSQLVGGRRRRHRSTTVVAPTAAVCGPRRAPSLAAPASTRHDRGVRTVGGQPRPVAHVLRRTAGRTEDAHPECGSTAPAARRSRPAQWMIGYERPLAGLGRRARLRTGCGARRRSAPYNFFDTRFGSCAVPSAARAAGTARTLIDRPVRRRSSPVHARRRPPWLRLGCQLRRTPPRAARTRRRPRTAISPTTVTCAASRGRFCPDHAARAAEHAARRARGSQRAGRLGEVLGRGYGGTVRRAQRCATSGSAGAARGRRPRRPTPRSRRLARTGELADTCVISLASDNGSFAAAPSSRDHDGTAAGAERRLARPPSPDASSR